jgi:hypothetical protein
VSDFDNYSKKVLACSAVLGAACAAAIFIATHRQNSELFAGFCLGAASSLLRWRLVIGELKKFAGRESGVGRRLRTFFIRYAITGAVIAISVASPAFSAITAIAGVFLVNVVIIGEQVIVAFRARGKVEETWE